MEALTLIRESMLKIMQPFDCAFIVNRIDRWDKDNVESNLDILYNGLREFMLSSGTIETTSLASLKEIFPPNRSGCEIFHGMSAKEACKDPRKGKRFLDFEKSFAAKLGERLRLRELKAVRALAFSIKFCYCVFGAEESECSLYHHLEGCKEVSDSMNETVFPKLRNYLKRSKREYKDCVKRIFANYKAIWIKKIGKLNPTSRMDSLWRRKQIIGRN